MAQTAKTARAAREIRHRRLRKKILGTTERPRLSIFRSLNHIYAQVIDDDAGQTVASASSLDPEIKPQVDGKRKREVARLVGAAIAQRASAAGIGSVVFDRGGYQYHGRIQALAEAAREGGLQF